jgi:hypothetical protein
MYKIIIFPYGCSEDGAITFAGLTKENKDEVIIEINKCLESVSLKVVLRNQNNNVTILPQSLLKNSTIFVTQED